jgi:hypothetical protein
MPCRGEITYGQDFGFNVESALVQTEFYEGTLYVKELLYETKLTTADLIERYKLLHVNKTKPIYCDSAEPKTIEELCRAGYNALPAIKAVTEGIRKLKSIPLIISEESTNLLKEIRNYKWRLNKDGLVLDEPVKFRDHACFVGNTLINTDVGLVPIKNIEPGMNILTSAGYRPSVQRFNNGYKQVHEYKIKLNSFEITLSCTPDHKIKTTAGWVPISRLKSGQTVYITSSDIAESFVVQHIEATEPYNTPVYNIEVEDMHEYFANGLLVKNCDAMRYACSYMLEPASEFWAY